MDIGGINRLRMLVPQQLDVKRNDGSKADRDAHGHGGYHQQPKPTILTPEQEEDAVKKLSEMTSFSKSGLRAELVRREGSATHVVIKDSAGTVIRHIAYEQMVDLYLERHSEAPTGRLLKRAA